MKRPNPFFSKLGCSAALLLVIILTTLLYWRGGTLFSPGPLSDSSANRDNTAVSSPLSLSGFNSHADFEADCGLCHAPWQGAKVALCLDCHQEIAAQQAASSGLHGRMPGTGRCLNCHTEHKGREANINLMALTDFEHERWTAFSLARHPFLYDGAPLECRHCHQERPFVADQVDCAGCHLVGEPDFTPEHAAFFGWECADCHDGRDTMVNFDHQAIFPLVGAHTAVTCQTCHQNQLFAGTPDQCADCHQEPAIHAGLFGLACAHCHTPQGWTPALLTEHTFPLDHGGEGVIACATCHEQRYTAYTCYNCHEHEQEDVEEEHRDEDIFNITDCAACHPTGREDEAKDRQ
jgi:hypothetical protein